MQPFGLSAILIPRGYINLHLILDRCAQFILTLDDTVHEFWIAHQECQDFDKTSNHSAPLCFQRCFIQKEKEYLVSAENIHSVNLQTSEVSLRTEAKTA